MTDADLRQFAAGRLGRDLHAARALLAGEHVPFHRLAMDVVTALGLTAESGPVVLDDALALRVELLGPSPADLIAASDPDKRRRPPTAAATIRSADALVDLVEDVEFFHDQDGNPWAQLPESEHFEIVRVTSRQMKTWLQQRAYELVHAVPSAQALNEALGVLEGRARFEGAMYPVWLRIAGDDERVVHDLADERRRVVEITGDAWRVLDRSPLRFRRPRGMAALPEPITGGSLDELLPYLNLDKDDEASFHLIGGFLTQALRPTGPYLGYAAYGEQGTAKSTRTRILRHLLDPSTSPLRALPSDERDLMISATNNWVVSFDNVSFISDWISDALCRLATGGGLATRQLYTDADEVIFDECRPLLVNSIEEVITRPDMLDRFITGECERIPDEKRRTEAEFWAAFEHVRPRVYGALLDAVSCALRNLATTHLERLPRMADAARWVTAAEPALGWEPGTFVAAFTDNRRSADDVVLESSVLAQRITNLADESFVGTATELLAYLNAELSPDQQRAKTWPKNGNSLVGKLKRLAPALRRSGIEIETGIREPGGRRRLVTIHHAPAPPSGGSVTGVTPVTNPPIDAAPAALDDAGGDEAQLGLIVRDASDASDATIGRSLLPERITEEVIEGLIARMPELRKWPYEEVVTHARQLLREEAERRERKDST